MKKSARRKILRTLRSNIDSTQYQKLAVAYFNKDIDFEDQCLCPLGVLFGNSDRIIAKKSIGWKEFDPSNIEIFWEDFPKKGYKDIKYLLSIK